MPEPINRAIIDRALTGETHALTELYLYFKPDVYRYLYYRLGETHLAEELTTDVFLRVIENLRHYRHQGIPFQAWLFRIAHNLAMDHFRQMNAHPQIDLDDDLVDHRESVDVLVERNLTRQQLQQSLRHLTADQCDVLILRFIADMPIREVAQALNKSESAVKGLQTRGLEALQRLFARGNVFHDSLR
jgi:RNA polymerase sigma-70 factor, ECF subfamily